MCVLKGTIGDFIWVISSIYAFQGTWFMQVGFILYSPSGATWHLDDHLQLMLVNVIYSWHFLGGSFIVLIIGTFAFARVKLLNKMQVFEKTHRQELQRKNANWKNDNEETKLIVDMHDEEELWTILLIRSTVSDFDCANKILKALTSSFALTVINLFKFRIGKIIFKTLQQNTGCLLCEAEDIVPRCALAGKINDTPQRCQKNYK